MLLSEMRLLEVKRGSYRDPPAHGGHLGHLGGAHLAHGHLPGAQVLVGGLGHQGLSRLLLVLQ